MSDPTGDALQSLISAETNVSAPPTQTRPTELTTYRHYRGGFYTLLYVAENSEQRDQLMAVYVSHLRRKVLVRPWDMFNEVIPWPDGTRRPRFSPVTELSDADISLSEEERAALRSAFQG